MEQVDSTWQLLLCMSALSYKQICSASSPSSSRSLSREGGHMFTCQALPYPSRKNIPITGIVQAAARIFPLRILLSNSTIPPIKTQSNTELLVVSITSLSGSLQKHGHTRQNFRVGSFPSMSLLHKHTIIGTSPPTSTNRGHVLKISYLDTLGCAAFSRPQSTCEYTQMHFCTC